MILHTCLYICVHCMPHTHTFHMTHIIFKPSDTYNTKQTHTHTCTHTYTHTYTHTHTHTHTQQTPEPELTTFIADVLYYMHRSDYKANEEGIHRHRRMSSETGVNAADINKKKKKKAIHNIEFDLHKHIKCNNLSLIVFVFVCYYYFCCCCCCCCC